MPAFLGTVRVVPRAVICQLLASPQRRSECSHFQAHAGLAALQAPRPVRTPHVISPVRSDSMMFEIHGPMLRALHEECPHAHAATIVLEFGTVPLLQYDGCSHGGPFVMGARRPAPLGAPGRRPGSTRHSSCTAQEYWYGMVVGRLKTAAFQWLLGLGSDVVRGLGVALHV